MKDYIFPILLVLMAVYFIIADIGSDAHEQAMQAKWDRERDSLTTALDTANARTMRSEERANYIAWQLDSARKNRPTPQQVIDRNLKAMEYAPLNSVRDTLMMP
mgnify:FL=1